MDPSVQYQEFFINEPGYPLGQQGPAIRSEMARWRHWTRVRRAMHAKMLARRLTP
jgi:hypothetical protein